MVNIPQMRTMVLEYIMNIVWDIIGYNEICIYIYKTYVNWLGMGK